MRRPVASMVVAQVAPGPLLRRHGSAAPPWLSSQSPFFLHRRFRRASPPRASSGRRRQEQDYSHSSDVAVRGRNIAQEWVQETRSLFYRKTANKVTNNIYKGSTLLAGNVQDGLSEDRRGSNYPCLQNLRECVSSKSIVNRHGDDQELIRQRMEYQPVQSVPAPISVVNDSPKCLSMPRASKVEIPWRDYAPADNPLLDKSNTEVIMDLDDENHDGDDNKEKKRVVKKVVSPLPTKAALSEDSLKARKVLASIYDKVLVVDNIESARSIVKLLTTKYKSFIHACHTKVADIDAKKMTPVGHGKLICFSIYSANSDVQAADFGNGKTCIWVDVLDGERGVLMDFAPFFEDPSIKKDAFGAERRKAKMLNFSIAYGKTAGGLSKDWKVSFEEARDTLELWYRDRKEVKAWQKSQKKLAREECEVYTLLGRSRHFPNLTQVHPPNLTQVHPRQRGQQGHIERAAINAPVQGSAADVVMCAMLEIERNARLKELGWRLLLQVHDEVILEGPSESAEVAKAIVVDCMSKPFYGTNILKVDLAVDAKCSKSWYAAKWSEQMLMTSVQSRPHCSDKKKSVDSVQEHEFEVVTSVLTGSHVHFLAAAK